MEPKTPYYVIHREEIDVNFKKLENALKKYWNNYIIGYSYKTNALPWIIKHFDSLGCFAETVSEDEYNLAKLIGVQNGRIIYNGPIKSKETFIDAVKNGCIVNIDSQREISWLSDLSLGLDRKAIGIRVNFDIEKMCPGQSQCADEGGRFGFCFGNGEFSKVVKELKNKNIRICGIHLHTSSKTRGIDIYRSIAEMACKIQTDFELNLDYVDIGGGFFGGLPSKPQYEEYIEQITSRLSKCFDANKTKLIVEPGMAVIGGYVSYVSTVIDVKDTTYNRFVVTDGTRTSIDPLMTKSAYFVNYESINRNDTIAKQVICGYTCMEHDRLFVAKDEPELCVGDRIIYNKVGAYTMCLTPLFIKYFPAVYVEEEGQLRIVREPWTAKEYVMKSELGD